ncbi:hypothetical protein C2G38_1066458 [Gigaspora rosea]|uniref:histidine kinase n=1 Tax=Gigaspora rosea TaxID=44941 RepID=A0A397TU63_9GLOM|nr:hypothetical protein C2G38_1066458 [Gigaspora rosea]
MIKEVQIKAIQEANVIKIQILANTLHGVKFRLLLLHKYCIFFLIILELRTPLGAIIGLLSSIKDDNLSAEQKDMINIMVHSSDIMLTIVNNILNMAKLETHIIT